MTGPEIVAYFFDRVIGSTVLSVADRKNEVFDLQAGWLEDKAGICADSFIKALARDIVLGYEAAAKAGRPFPAFDLEVHSPSIRLADYARTHRASDRENVERALAGTLWDMKAR